MIDTVVARAGGSAALRAVGWQQLVDLLARSPEEPVQAERAYDALETWRPAASAGRRARTCATVADRPMPERLFEHLALDDPAIAAPVLVSAPVPDGALIALLPRLSGPARAQLRNRARQSDALRRALDAYGPADRALETAADRIDDATVAAETEDAPPAPDRAPRADSDASPVTIRALVDRIDRFRQVRPRRAAAPAERPPAQRPSRRGAVAHFAFETDRGGIVRWTDAPARGAVIGLALSEAALDDGPGVDAPAAELFGRRAPIAGARLVLPAGSPMAGVWRFHATPVFAPSDGRFTGYAGQARRRSGPEGAGVENAQPWPLARSGDVRQLVHELKTPLNAIIGFSELIGEELLGPVPAAYREHAAAIRGQGLAVLASIDDVDLSARLDAGAGSGVDSGTAADDVGDLTAAVAAALARIDPRGDASSFAPRLGDERWVCLDRPGIDRAVGRLLSGLAGAAARGERLAVTVTGRKRPRLRVATPRALAQLDPEALAALRLPEGHTAPGAPLLGLTFTLRLVRRLAERAGGELRVDASEFTLFLPPAMQDRSERRQ